MMKIDDREVAIAKAFTWLGDGVPAKTPAGPLLKAFRKAIEAYESARPDPNPWRPIADAPRDGETGPWILVHWYAAEPIAHIGAWTLMFWASSQQSWCEGGGTQTYQHSHLVERKAKFRTIEPPSCEP